MRELGVRQPITIGTHQASRKKPNGEVLYNMDLYAPLCDVLTCHPYARTPEQMKAMHEVCKSIQTKHRKPMLCNECIPRGARMTFAGQNARVLT